MSNRHPFVTIMRARARNVLKALSSQVEEHEPQSAFPETKTIFNSVSEIYIAGGGGAGRALPSALLEAQKYGLNFDNVNVVCATSVGTIVGLGLTLGIAPEQMKKLLNDMPTERFQDWSLRRIIHFFTEWGVCSGKEINAYIRKLIKDKTGLEDPTFLELYQAGYTKEFRVLTTNVSKHRTAIFSFRETPYKKVSDLVTTACSIPLVYSPHWIVNHHGELEAHTDGGLIKNYPFGLGGDPTVPIQAQLGFNFVNKGSAYALENDKHTLIDSFWRYFRSLISLVLFQDQDPASVSDSIKDRTVVIAVNHNPLNFNASKEEQLALDKAGIKGVHHLVERILKHKERKSTPPPLLFNYGQRQFGEQKLAPAPLLALRRSPRLQKLR
ncbi:MAG: patatin-like phospholipase family protein [Proteobacteria bacterium]|nr:patatin-like phospholipase family protein [Pseudomonadota bacterium]